MFHRISAHRTPKSPIFTTYQKADRLWGWGLWLTALLLFTIDLGGVAIRDWDEGIVAQVARELITGNANWLHPTLNGDPYLNKPPLIHWFIALFYQIGGVNEWTARLPGALLTATSVPLLYTLGREIFHRRTQAIFSALVYLTLIPVVRHGRLAMLDGAVLFFLVLMMVCVLRARRDLRYALGSGLAFGLLCLTKGVLLGVLLGAIAFGFLLWDTPRLLTSKFLWWGLGLGLVPVAFWYASQWQYYGFDFIIANLVDQSLVRIWESVENHKGPPWYYLLEIIKLSAPWLLFWLGGLRLAWRDRNLSWARLTLVWTGVYLIAVSAMNTKLPWYIMPIYPAFALAVGSYLALVWEEGDHEIGRWQKTKPSPSVPPDQLLTPDYLCPRPDRLWPLFSILAFVAWLGGLYFGGMLTLTDTTTLDINLQLTCASVALTMAVSTLLLVECDRQFLVILCWGMYLSLLLFVSSHHWVWELGESYPVKPVASLIQQHTAPEAKIYTSYPYSRPSLDFYSGRQIRPVDSQALQHYWHNSPSAYFLVDQQTLHNLQLPDSRVLGTIEGWTLIMPSEIPKPIKGLKPFREKGNRLHLAQIR
ncbi:glycosyltransferase family 39 protein [Limnospira fusiformis KN01]|uniref:Glycosyl transferase, family 39 n=3 Tax=Oscillatoriales TaxID=1150 RepID=A0A9P1KFC8_9CYAN|nr:MULTISPECIES: glycosyltransferase family 39 protein [Limnospira]EKD06353.1 glycosyl transferase family 39 [Arthrospira platensis C1]SMN35256.1 Glycosyl transferase,family 39 [Arthrospira sp. SRM16]MDT9199852.1 glycosyltransferase family 39 protein [Limnospira sp. PMC 1042.18]MDT9276417.1 glycosyltransferase family 39 protein [Limnospira sp. PMC 737.11]ULB48118.1 glycosyltransferase family 39 protein [Limnospira fusiformis KN01]